MVSAVLKTSAGETTIEIPPPGAFPSFYIFAMHKSGSSLLNRMISHVLYAARVPQIVIPDTAFAAGLPENDILNPHELIFARGYGYRGFRMFPPYLHDFDITNNKKILLVRDPRDMVVSQYFSTAFSHVIPAGGTVRDTMLKHRAEAEASDVNDYCLANAASVKSEFDEYHPLLKSEIRIYRYEDVIFEKVEWLREMVRYLDVDVPSPVIERIAKENDIIPAKERPHEHIRQVSPGNFRKHLKNSTIDRLDLQFGDILKEYRYQELEAQRPVTRPAKAGIDLVFSTSGNAAECLRSGFSFPEPWGTWTIEPTAKIAVPGPQPGALSMRIEFRSFARRGGPPAGFTVLANGRRVGSFAAQSGEWGQIYRRTFKIPEERAGSELLEIEFRIENGAAAHEIGPGRRPLGIGLQRIRIQPAAAEEDPLDSGEGDGPEDDASGSSGRDARSRAFVP